MLRKPEDRPVVPDRDPREGVPERVERALLARRADAGDSRALQRRASRENVRLVRGLAALAPPSAEEIDHVLRDEYLALLVILRGLRGSRPCTSYELNHGVHEVSVAPCERQKLPCRVPVLSATDGVDAHGP